MAQKISRGSILGRIGTGIGEGLAEQLPKEVDRHRLSSGLKQFEQDSAGLSPMQQVTRLASIPGALEHPQLIQSLAELSKQQQIRDAYRNTKRASEPYTPTQDIAASPRPKDFQFGEIPGRFTKSPQNNQQNNQQQPQTIPSDMPRAEEAKENPAAASENPLSAEFIPPSPWTNVNQEQAINEAFDRGIARTFDEASAYANNQKQIYENSPEAYRKQLDYKRGVDERVDNLFDSHMQTRLQKEGKETFNDLTGDLQLNLKKLARNSVSTGKMNPDQAAEYYSKKALDLVKDKGRVLRIANRDVLDRVLPHKKEEALKNLMHISDTFSDLGSSEDYYNLLKTDTIDENGRQQGVGASAGRAAMIAYKPTENVKTLMRNSKISEKNPTESTREFTQNLLQKMTPKDSFLAVARNMKDKDPNFDEYAFFDYLRENKDQYASNKRLDREVGEGVSDFFPNWRDIGLFPVYGKSVAND